MLTLRQAELDRLQRGRVPENRLHGLLLLRAELNLLACGLGNKHTRDVVDGGFELLHDLVILQGHLELHLELGLSLERVAQSLLLGRHLQVLLRHLVQLDLAPLKQELPGAQLLRLLL